MLGVLDLASDYAAPSLIIVEKKIMQKRHEDYHEVLANGKNTKHEEGTRLHSVCDRIVELHLADHKRMIWQKTPFVNISIQEMSARIKKNLSWTCKSFYAHFPPKKINVQKHSIQSKEAKYYLSEYA